MIYVSGLVSLIVQFAVGIIDYLAINIEVNPKDELLKDLLRVELFVQIIEFIFYIMLITYLTRKSQNITPYRYLDWAITTPLMLITLSAFLQHDTTTSGTGATGTGTGATGTGTGATGTGTVAAPRLVDFLAKHKGSIVKIVLLNAAMLLFGLIGEFGYMTPYMSTTLGFIPFIVNFKYIKDRFLPSSEDKLKNLLFYWFVFFWALYGVFAVMGYTVKNTGYNILDIFAKNFFGIFLAYVIWSKSNVEPRQPT